MLTAHQVDPAIGEAGDIDTSLVVLTFENGVVATVDNCRQASYGYDQRVEVFGSKGMVQLNNAYGNNCVVSNGESVKRDLPFSFFMDRYADAYRNEMVAFVDCCNSSDKKSPVGVNDGRAAYLIGKVRAERADSMTCCILRCYILEQALPAAEPTDCRRSAVAPALCAAGHVQYLPHFVRNMVRANDRIAPRELSACQGLLSARPLSGRRATLMQPASSQFDHEPVHTLVPLFPRVRACTLRLPPCYEILAQRVERCLGYCR